MYFLKKNYKKLYYFLITRRNNVIAELMLKSKLYIMRSYFSYSINYLLT